MKEKFMVTVTRSDGWFKVSVESDETFRKEIDFCLFFTRWTARKLKRKIIKSRKPKSNYKKTYKI